SPGAAVAATPRVYEVLLTNRSCTMTALLASLVGGRVVEHATLGAALEEVDRIPTSTGSPTVILEAADLAPVLPARHGRPLLIVDVAVPRDVDPGVAELAGVTLLDMDDLRAYAEEGMVGRRREVARVRALVADEVDRWVSVTTG